MGKLESKYKNASKAFKALKRSLARDWHNDAELRDSVIQRFEFTVETCWKLYQAYFKEGGIDLDTPKATFKQLLKAGVLDEDETKLALDMIDDRNRSSHTYNEELAIDISNKVPDYVPIFEKMLSNRNLTDSCELL